MQSASFEPTPRVSDSPSATPIASPVRATRPPVADAWRSVPIASEGQVRDLISTPTTGLLAVGTAGWNGAVWRSADGETWAPATDIPPVDDNTAMTLIGVLRTANRYVAWGMQGARGSEFYQSVIWTSSDGSQWQEVAVLEGLILAVALGGPGFVAVGSKPGLDYLNGALAWSSSDGIVWTDSPPVPGPAGAAMLDIAPFGGGFVAVGAAGSEPEPLQAVSWTSRDGVVWDQLPLDPALDGGGFADVLVRDGHLVASGSVVVYAPNSLRRPVIWDSDDGSHWTEAYTRDCCGEFTDLIDKGGELWALLYWYDESNGFALVRSGNGTAWELVGTPQVDPGTTWQGLVSTQQGLLGLAYRDTEDGSIQPALLLPQTAP